MYSEVLVLILVMLLCADSDHWLRFVAEHVLDAALKLPLIYMMDCTRNDCGFIIRPILQV